MEVCLDICTELTCRLKKEMQLEDGAFDPDADLISGAVSPAEDEKDLQDSDDSLAADLIAELDDLDLGTGNLAK